eukprot:gene9526-biopygen1296
MDGNGVPPPPPQLQLRNGTPWGDAAQDRFAAREPYTAPSSSPTLHAPFVLPHCSFAERRGGANPCQGSKQYLSPLPPTFGVDGWRAERLSDTSFTVYLRFTLYHYDIIS